MIANLLSQAFAYVCFFYLKITSPKIPKFDAEKYRQDNDWSAEDDAKEPDSSIRPFAIQVPEAVITDLKDRLSRHRPQDSISQDFEYGFNSRHLKQVIDYWINVYDWQKEEAVLNTYDHFKTRIEGLDVHFVHVKAKDTGSKQVIPLLLVHGWPGSFYEFYKSIPYLVAGTDSFVFELVIPSIPGYGFSDAPRRPGFSATHAGRIFAKLMERLGHEKFVYQGGDWGSVIGRSMAIVFPERLIGYHTNMPISSMSFRNTIRIVAGSCAPHLFFDDPESETRLMYPIKSWFFRMLRESGYMHLQSTKPDTVGVALNNDPAGLAAYILEKFSTWTDETNRSRPDGGLTLSYTLDELLTNVMIYWINGNITSSQRLYKEHFSSTDETSAQVVTVKAGVVVAEKELFARPASLLKEGMTNIVHVTKVEKAGHFFAFQQPQVFAEDVKAFVTKITES